MTRTHWLLVACLVFLGVAWLYSESEAQDLTAPGGPPSSVEPAVPEEPMVPDPPGPIGAPVGQAPAVGKVKPAIGVKPVVRPAQPVQGPGPMGQPPVIGGPPPGGGTGPGFPGPMGFPTPGGPGESVNYKEIVPTLIAALEDKDGEVRQSVAAALASIGSPAVKPLLEVFKDTSKDASLRANAAYTLGQMGPAAREALPDLVKAIKDDKADVQIRKRAAYAVSQVVSASGSYYGPMGYPGMPETPGNSKFKGSDPGLVVPARVIKKD